MGRGGDPRRDIHDPENRSVGLQQHDAEKQGRKIKIASSASARSDALLAMAETDAS